MDINKIASIIKEGLSEYQTKEEIIKEEIASMDVEYATQNERPIAAFMTEYLAKELTTKDNEVISFHELPIKGLNEERVDEIKKEFLKNSGISNKLIHKKFKSYNIDGFLKIKNPSKKVVKPNNFNSVFIEYKVNTTFKFIDLVQDFLKFLIYSGESSKSENFIYVVFFKKESTFKEISEDALELNESLENKSDFEGNNVFWFKSIQNTQNNESKNELETNLVALERLNEISDSTPTAITEDEYSMFKKSLSIQNIKIYGQNVFFSYKMMLNSSRIFQINEELSKKSIGTDAKETNEENYIEIKKFIKDIRNSEEASKVTTDSKKKVIKQMTNWVLSIIKCVADKHKIKSDLIIGEVNEKGRIWGEEALKPSFDEMVKDSKKLLDKNAGSDAMVYKIIRHITEVYKMTYVYEELGESQMPKINEKYATFKKVEKESSNLNNIHKTLLGKKKTGLILDIKDFAEDVSKQKLFNVIDKNTE